LESKRHLFFILRRQAKGAIGKKNKISDKMNEEDVSPSFLGASTGDDGAGCFISRAGFQHLFEMGKSLYSSLGRNIMSSNYL
jgi:hypothetical protein